MVRSKKRKNAGPGVDFRRAKRKVGRKLPKAQNATDTTIRTRSIHVPGQSVAADRENSALSKRRLSLKELLQQVGHYNGRVRRDAFEGLLELFVEHPASLKQHLSHVMRAASEGMVDVEKSVRAANRKFLARAVFPNVRDEEMMPFLSLVMAHVCCALTHLEGQIRSDGLRFLQLLVEHYGAPIRAMYLRLCLEQFLHLLGKERCFRRLESQSQSALHEVLKTMNTILSEPIESTASSETAQEPAVMATGLSLSRKCASLFPLEARVLAGDDQKQLQELLVSLLQSCKYIFESWLLLVESSSTIPEKETHLQNSVESLISLHLISQRLTTNESTDMESESMKKFQSVIQALCSKIGDRFPWMSDPLDSAEIRKSIGAFNLTATKLLLNCKSYLLETELQSVKSSLCQFHLDLMEEASNHATAANREAFSMLLPNVRDLLDILDSMEKESIMHRILSCCDSFAEEPVTQLKCLCFIRTTLQQQYGFKREDNCLTDAAIEKLVQFLPKWIWKAGSKNPANIQVCLEILHLVAKTANSHVNDALRRFLREFLLFILVPSRNKDTGEVVYMIGPCGKCPLNVQLLFLDALFYFPQTEEPLMDIASLFFVLRSKRFSDAFASRLLFVFTERLKTADNTVADTAYLHKLAEELLCSGSSGQAASSQIEVKRTQILHTAALHLIMSVMTDAKTFVLQIVEKTMHRLSSDDENQSVVDVVLCAATKLLHSRRNDMEVPERHQLEKNVAELSLFHAFGAISEERKRTGCGDCLMDCQVGGNAQMASLPLLQSIYSLLPSVLGTVLEILQHKLKNVITDQQDHSKICMILLALLQNKGLKNEWSRYQEQLQEILLTMHDWCQREGCDRSTFESLTVVLQHVCSPQLGN